MNVRTVRAMSLLTVLALGATLACSDDDAPSPATITTSADATNGEVPAAETDTDDETGSNMSDDDRESVARAVMSIVGADSFEIDGDTVTYQFSDGSSEDAGSALHCTSMITIQGAFEQIFLEYPDGSLECGSSTLG